MIELVRERLQLLREMTDRAAPGPLLLRGLLFVLATLALVLALPSGMLLGRGGAIALAGGAVVAAAPRGRMVTTFLLATGFAWLLTTVAFGDRVLAWRLLALAAAMYLVHTLAALASVLPYDAVIPPGVLAAWLVRASIVVAASSAFGLFALVERPRLGSSTFMVASVVGVAVVGVLVWVLTRSVRR